MGRRGARWRLSRMHAGYPPRRERADDNVEHGDTPFAVVEKRDGILRNISIPVTAPPRFSRRDNSRLDFYSNG